MSKMRFSLALAAVVVGVGMTALPVAAQEREQREELERRLRELQEEIRDIQRQLADLGGVRRSYRGIITISANRAQLGVFVQMEPDPETDRIGARLESVTEDGPAAAAGLEDGDIIVSFDGEPLTGRYPAAGPDESEPARKLIDLIGDKEPGDEVTLEYQRDGGTRSTVVTLGEGDLWFPGPAPRVGLVPGTGVRIFSNPGRGGISVWSVFGDDPWSDIELVRLNEDLGRYFGTSEGLLVVSPPDEEDLDLRAGDVILNIDGREPGTPARALRIIRSYESGETMNLEIMRDRSRMTVSYEIPERGYNRLRPFDFDERDPLIMPEAVRFDVALPPIDLGLPRLNLEPTFRLRVPRFREPLPARPLRLQRAL
jgi:hypothetical protein